MNGQRLHEYLGLSGRLEVWHLLSSWGLGHSPLLSQVPMSMLCFMCGGGSAPPITGSLFAFIFCCSFAWLLAMAAHKVGFETGMFMFVPPLPGRTPVIAALLTTNPIVLTEEVVTSPVLRPTMPCSRLFIPGACCAYRCESPSAPPQSCLPGSWVGRCSCSHR